MAKFFKELVKPIYYRIFFRKTWRICPICKKISRHFLEFGILSRQDAKCPICLSLERHRLLWLFLKKRTRFFKNPPKNFLHIAPEIILQNKFRKFLDEGYISADLYRQNVDVKMDITHITFPDNYFDFIYCSHVLEHVPDDRKAMREFLRVLKKEGEAILLVPIEGEKTQEDLSVTDPTERLKLYGQEDHVRHYGLDYKNRLEEEGFKVDRIFAEEFLNNRDTKRMGITKAAGDIYLCKKI